MPLVTFDGPGAVEIPALELIAESGVPFEASDAIAAELTAREDFSLAKPSKTPPEKPLDDKAPAAVVIIKKTEA